MDRRDTMNRYARQIAVPEFGPESQVRLKDARLLVAGAGGLAAPLLPALVGAGVGHIRLVDPDVVDVSNLHRQTLFRTGDVGLPKVNVAADRLRDLNPDTIIEPLRVALDPSNAAALAAGTMLLIDSIAARRIPGPAAPARQLRGRWRRGNRRRGGGRPSGSDGTRRHHGRNAVAPRSARHF